MVQGGGPEVAISEERLRRYRTRVPPVDTMYPHLQTMRSNMKELNDLWSRASQFPGLPSRSPSRLSAPSRSAGRLGAESPPFSTPLVSRQYTRVTSSEGAPNRSLTPRTNSGPVPAPLSCPSCRTDMAPPSPGIRSTCRGCKETYSVVHCPFCEGPNYFPGDSFVQGQDTRCAHGYRTFSLVLCPRCAERFYSDRFLQGVKTICNACTYSYSMVSCPKCTTPNFWPSDEFMQGELTECSRCLHQFSMVLCNRCGIATFWAGRVPEILNVRCSDCEMASPADRLDSTLFVPDIPLRPSSPGVGSQLGSRSPRSGAAPRYPPFMPPAGPFGAAPPAVALPPHELRGQYCTRELCRQFVRSLNLPAIYFDPTYDECYCDDCYREDEPDVGTQAGRKYVVPRQWTRFGLRIDPVRTEVDNIWRDWCISYHGLNEKVLPSVLYHRQLLLPGDILLDGSILEGNTDREPLMYTSPSINYSSLFSPPIEFTTADGQVLHAQMVLQCRQKPGTFMAKPGNPNVTRESCPYIPHQQVEYCSNTLSSIVPYGLLIRICE